MPKHNKSTLVWSFTASQDLIRLRNFIEPHNKNAARRAADAIKKAAAILIRNPLIGTIAEGREEYQEHNLFIPFGKRGYAMRYRVQDNKVIILRVWHGLENR
jgi:plasmid stabilization system protein ParE